MAGGYNGWKDSDGEWRFGITILPEGGTPGQMIFGLLPEGGSEPESKGLTETEFRQIMSERYGQTSTQIDNAVARVKSGKTVNDP